MRYFNLILLILIFSSCGRKDIMEMDFNELVDYNIELIEEKMFVKNEDVDMVDVYTDSFIMEFFFNEENINISKLFSEDGIKLLNERKKLLGDMDRNVLDSLNTYFKSLYSKHLEKLSSDLRKEEQERLKKIKEEQERLDIKQNKYKSKSNECNEPDDTGNYMNRVLDELNGKGYGISGYYFGGNGFYNVTVIKPTGTIGSSEVEVLVNKCGEILRIIE